MAGGTRWNVRLREKRRGKKYIYLREERKLRKASWNEISKEERKEAADEGDNMREMREMAKRSEIYVSKEDKMAKRRNMFSLWRENQCKSENEAVAFCYKREERLSRKRNVNICK